MGEKPSLPILITGGGRRIDLAAAWHFPNQKQPVIVSHHTHYPVIGGLREAGAICIPVDFSTDEGTLTLTDEVRAQIDGLCAIVHNVSTWLVEKPGTPLTDVLSAVIQIHINTPYLLNHALEGLLRGHGHTANSITHSTDYVIKRGSDEHIAYVAGRTALDDTTCSFSRKLTSEVKVNAIAPSLILLNEGGDAEYRQQALDKSLMKTAPGEKEVIDLTGYLLTSCFIIGRSFALDDGRHLR